MTAEKYFKICEQRGEEVNPEKIPPEFEDFPHEIQQAILVFGKLADKVVVDIGYLGKDYTTVPLHMEILEIENKDLFLETLLRLDEKLIKKSAEEMKRERDKAKNRSK